MAVKTFSVNEVLTAADTNTYLANSGLVYIATATATTGTTLNVPNCFNSTYDHYRVVLSDVRTTGSAGGVTIQLGDPTNVATNYYWAATYLSGYSVSPTFNAHGGGNVTAFETNLVAQGSQSANAFIDISNPNKALVTNIMCTAVDARTNGNPRQPSTGFHNGTNAFTGIYFICSTTLTNMTATVYGYRKA